MRLIGKVSLLIYSVLLIIGGVVAYFYWGGRVPAFTKVNVFKTSINIDSSINDLLVEWGVEDTDITSEYRKEVQSGEDMWIVVNRDISIFADTLPSEYQDLLKEAVHGAGGGVYRLETKGNRCIIESGAKKQVLNRLIITFLRKKAPDTAFVAIVIDDVGYNKEIVEPFLKLGIPLTFAVLPQEVFSSELAEYIHKNGGEIIVHMPMEPMDYPKVSAGDHALLLRMSKEEISERFFENLYSLPFAVGISNHMGSRFMENGEKLEVFMSCISQSGLFFLDSRTTARSLVPEFAKELEIPHLISDVFLDTEDDLRHIEQQMRLLGDRAKKMNTAIGIGHVHKKNTSRALKKSLRFFQYQNIELVTLSELLQLSRKN